MTTFEQVKKIVAEKLGVPEEKVTESAAFVNDLGADSLDVVEFVMEVEKEFNITIPDEEATKLENTILKLIPNVAKYNISGTTLCLMNVDDMPLLVFQKQELVK